MLCFSCHISPNGQTLAKGTEGEGGCRGGRLRCSPPQAPGPRCTRTEDRSRGRSPMQGASPTAPQEEERKPQAPAQQPAGLQRLPRSRGRVAWPEPSMGDRAVREEEKTPGTQPLAVVSIDSQAQAPLVRRGPGPQASMTLSLVHRLPFLRPFLVGTYNCRPKHPATPAILEMF